MTMTNSQNQRHKDFVITHNQFLYMKMITSRYGINLNQYNIVALTNRLSRRLNQLGLENCDAYCKKLMIDIHEEEQFINLITNPTTAFFRETHHFDYLAEHVLPTLLAHQRKIRIWCAGCATGEEAYTLAMIALESISTVQNHDIKILATDVNSSSLTIAKQGIYDVNKVHSISKVRQAKWFNHRDNEGIKKIEANNLLKELIVFNQHNLLGHWPMKKTFDIIFCRNVMIYFKQDAINNVLRNFHAILNNDGFLFLGHSETIDNNALGFKLLGKSIYKKI